MKLSHKQRDFLPDALRILQEGITMNYHPVHIVVIYQSTYTTNARPLPTVIALNIFDADETGNDEAHKQYAEYVSEINRRTDNDEDNDYAVNAYYQYESGEVSLVEWDEDAREEDYTP